MNIMRCFLRRGALCVAALTLTAGAFGQHDAVALSARQKAALDELFSAFLEDKEGPAKGASKMRTAMQTGLLESLRGELESGGPALGNSDGDVVIVEFFDYQCGYCRRVFEPLMNVVSGDGNVRVVVREYPILGEMSQVAARAGLAAHKQGKYEAFHTEMLSRPGPPDNAAIEAAATVAGMDLARMRADMESPEIAAEIARNHEFARVLNIGGTPAFIIGDAFIPGAIQAEAFQQLITSARNGASAH